MNPDARRWMNFCLDTSEYRTGFNAGIADFKNDFAAWQTALEREDPRAQAMLAEFTAWRMR